MTEAGTLKEAFLAVVNTQPADERVIAKNAERVVAARLRDAKFFWEADRVQTLESRLDRLHTVLFHKKLGSYRDKAERIEKLAAWIATEAFGRPEIAPDAAKAARLAKADLTSDMVFEFPELQGTMGGIYAREEGLPEQVWKAIYLQYLPIGVEADARPSQAELGPAAATWAAVSLADKVDTFVSLTKAGERATGSRDPFALRRQIQGAVRILMDLPELTGINVEVALLGVFNRAIQLSPGGEWADAQQLNAALEFARERVRFILEHRGYEADLVRAATSFETVVPLQARRMVEALRIIKRSEDFQALAVLFKRVKNIAKELPAVAPLDRTALTEPAELALLADLDALGTRVRELAGQHDYRGALAEIATLRAPVDRFFTDVFVMAEDAPSQDSAPDTHGRTTRLDSHARRHLGNRSSNGVGQQKWQRSRLGRSRRSSRRRIRRRRRRPPAASAKNATRGGEVRLPLRPQDGRQRIDEAAARRQGREPRRDVPHRPAGAARLHGHDRGLHLLLRQQAHVSAAAQGPDAVGHRRHRAADRQEARRSAEPAAGVGPLRRPRLDAGHDGHDPQPRSQRPDGRGAGHQDRQPALRVGLLPPLRPDVR